MNENGKPVPLWQETVLAPRPQWPSLQHNVATDVVIIGAGITGLSTAWHLVNAGVRVVVLEANEVGSGTTGSSTGNLYVPVGSRLHAVEKKHGTDALLNVAAARSAALDFMETRAREQQNACEFRRVPFHLFTAPDDGAAEEVQQELAAAQKVGLAVSDGVPPAFPFSATALTTIEGQAQFNPLRYVLDMAQRLTQNGCSIHENSRVIDTQDGDPCTVTTAAGQVTARHVVKATHIPQGLYAVHAAMLPHREYAVLARVKEATLPVGIYWNANAAWRYSVRPWQSAGDNFVMVIGEPHKPGEQDPDQLAHMRQFLQQHFPTSAITNTWAAQNYQSADLLPYIGRSPLEQHTWIATGFAGDGLVWGTCAGKLISDGIQEIANPGAKTFDPRRFTPLASATNVLKESVAVSRHLLQDLLVYGGVKQCQELVPGDGCVMKLDGEKVAACRDRDGRLHVVSAVCTHMGCLVHWNALEQSWDCPCHGSRFSMDGRVLEGPAQADLPTAQATTQQ